MGIYSSAKLIWGVPITNYDEDGEPSAFWDEAEEDWREFEGLKVATYGHYEDPDAERAILTTEAIPRFRGDCWDPRHVGDRDLDVNAYHDDAVSEFHQRVSEIDETLLGACGWWLVASVG